MDNGVIAIGTWTLNECDLMIHGGQLRANMVD